MKKNLFVVGALLTMAMFFSSCGGGGNSDDSIHHEYIVENISLGLAGAQFWSENSSTWNLQLKQVEVFQNGEPFQTLLQWKNFPIQKGDQLEFFIEGIDGGEVSLKIKGGADKIYAQQNFIFQGKNTITLVVDADDNQAEVFMMFGKQAGKYSFSTSILVRRTRIKTATQTETINLDIEKGQFWSDSGSVWDPTNGTINVKIGKERWSTMLRWDGIPIKAGKVHKIIVLGYALPLAEIIVQLKQGDQNLGEKAIELHWENIIGEIVPTQSDENGSVVILLGLEAGTYLLKELKIIITE